MDWVTKIKSKLEALKRSVASIYSSFKPKNPNYIRAAFKKAWFSVIAAGLIMQLNFTGIGNNINIYFENLYTRIISGPLYPIWKDNFAQNKITVILIDQYNKTWPPSYKKQAEWLEELKLYEPKAIFIDFIYSKKHDGANDLNVLVETIKKSKIPIYIPFLAETKNAVCTALEPVTGNKIWKTETTIKDIREAITGEKYGLKNKKTYIGWSECGNRYPLYLGNNSGFPTPALTMFRQYCEDFTNSPVEQVTNVCKLTTNPTDEFLQPMAIDWGTKPSDDNKKLFKDFGLQCNDAGFWKQSWQIISSVLDSNPQKGVRSNCTYSDTILFSMFNSPIHQDIDPFKKYIKDRYIFIGADINLNKDLIINSVNGQVSGVYLHAMAFDNLINYGVHYKRDMDSAYKTLYILSFLFMFMFTLIFFDTLIQTKVTEHNRLSNYSRFIFIKLFIPAIFLLILVFAFITSHISTVDWLAIIFAIFKYNPIEISEIRSFIWEDLKNWVKKNIV